MSPKDETVAVNIPAFLSKLWKIVNDPDIDNIVSWSPDGRSFIIQDQAQFWYNILPIYYKHNNMSSFVRQLNMYGFHKIHSDDKEKEHDELKFFHPYFRKNQQSLMKNIKRKITTTHRTPVPKEDPVTSNQVTNIDHMTKVLVDVKTLQTRQDSVDSQLASMKKENAALWRELALLRQKHMKQQQLVNKLIHFLVHIVNPSRSDLGGMGRKRKLPLMINDAARSSKSPKTDSNDDGIIIHEVENEFILPGSVPSEDEELPSDLSEETAQVDSPDTTYDLMDIPTEDVVNSPNSCLGTEILLAQEPDVVTEDIPEEEINPDFTNENIEFPLDDSNLQQNISEESLEDVPDMINIDSLVIPHDNGNILAEEQEQLPQPSTSTSTEELFPNLTAVSSSEVTEDTSKIEDNTKKKTSKAKDKALKKNLTVATRKQMPEPSTIQLKSPDDFESHLDATQEELDSIKELLLDGYSLNVNNVFGLNNNLFMDMPIQLFMSDENNPQSEDMPSTSKTDNSDLPSDPMVSGSGSEIMPYSNSSSLLDFENLFESQTSPENTSNCPSELMDLVKMSDAQSPLNTPVSIKVEAPTFPSSFNTDSTNK